MAASLRARALATTVASAPARDDSSENDPAAQATVEDADGIVESGNGADLGAEVIATVVDDSTGEAGSDLVATVAAMLTEDAPDESEVSIVSDAVRRAAEVNSDTEVVTVDPGRQTTVTTDSAGTVEVSLDPGERSTVVETDDGTTILIIDDSLSEEEVIDETIACLLQEIGYQLVIGGNDILLQFRDVFQSGILQMLNVHATKIRIENAQALYLRNSV